MKPNKTPSPQSETPNGAAPKNPWEDLANNADVAKNAAKDDSEKTKEELRESIEGSKKQLKVLEQAADRIQKEFERLEREGRAENGNSEERNEASPERNNQPSERNNQSLERNGHTPERNNLVPEQDNSFPEQKSAIPKPKKPEGEKKRAVNQDDSLSFAAINIDNTEELQREAHRYADEAVNAEVAHHGLILRIWKGSLFNKFYKERYAQQYMKGERTIDSNGQQVTLAEKLAAERGESHLARMTYAVFDSLTSQPGQNGSNLNSNDTDFLHKGETLKVNEKETTFLKGTIKDAYQKYNDDLNKGVDPKDALINYKNYINEACAKARDQGNSLDNARVNNYTDIATNILQKAEHDEGIERVLKNFKVLDAKVTDAVRSDEHNNKIDNLINKLEGKSGFGMVMAQAAAGAVGVASAFCTSGARALGGVGLGIAASSALAGGKAYHKATVDRATMMRRKAVGLESSGTSDHPEQFNNRRARKTAKYEAKLGETVYEMAKAPDLIDNLNDALKNGAIDEILRGVAEIEVRRKLSENKDIDLIAYSSAKNVGRENLDMLVALQKGKKYIEAQKNGKEQLGLMMQKINKDILEDIGEKDAEFKSEQHRAAAKAAFKSATIGTASYFASQEFMALVDENKVGLLEELGLVKTVNNEDAKQTILSRLAEGPRSHIVNSVHVRADDTVTLNKLTSNGYTKTLVRPPSTTTQTVTQDIPFQNANGSVNPVVSYANNGTSFSDGNELRLFNNGRGIASGMSGVSYMPNGAPIDVGQKIANGELVGRIGLMDKNGVLKYFYTDRNLIDQNGIAHLIDAKGASVGTVNIGHDFYTLNAGFVDGNGGFTSCATVVNGGIFDGKIGQTIQQIIEDPGEYRLDKFVENAMTTEGVFIPTMSTNHLGEARQGDNPTNRTRSEFGEGEGGGTSSEEGDNESDGESESQEGGNGGTIDSVSVIGEEDSVDNQPPATVDQPIPPIRVDQFSPSGETNQTAPEIPPIEQNQFVEPAGVLPLNENSQPVGELPFNQPTQSIGWNPPAPVDDPTNPDASTPDNPALGWNPPELAGQPVESPSVETSQAANGRPSSENSPQAQVQTQPQSEEIDETMPEILRRRRDSSTPTRVDANGNRVVGPTDYKYSTEEKDLFDRVAKYRNIIGNNGVIYLTENYYDSIPNEHTQNMYSSWYDGLSDQGRAAVAEILDIINNSGAHQIARRGEGGIVSSRPTNMGRGFAEWLQSRNNS